MNLNDQYSIVSVGHPDGHIFGAGVLISRRYVVTCAHVVRAVLSLPGTTNKPPTGQVLVVNFPLAFSLNRKKGLSARIVVWAAPDHDVAVLELSSDDHQ